MFDRWGGGVFCVYKGCGGEFLVGAMGLVAYGSTVGTRVLRKTLRGRKVRSVLRGRGFSALCGDYIDDVTKISVLITSSSCRGTIRILESGRD